jgi:hypothetical protein
MRNIKINDLVIIGQNPHHSSASNVVGVVMDIQPGEGAGGCDLVYVRYPCVHNGVRCEYTKPFDLSCFIEDQKILTHLCDYHKDQLRALSIVSALTSHRKFTSLDMKMLDATEP